MADVEASYGEVEQAASRIGPGRQGIPARLRVVQQRIAARIS